MGTWDESVKNLLSREPAPLGGPRGRFLRGPRGGSSSPALGPTRLTLWGLAGEGVQDGRCPSLCSQMSATWGRTLPWALREAQSQKRAILSRRTRNGFERCFLGDPCWREERFCVHGFHFPEYRCQWGGQ